MRRAELIHLHIDDIDTVRGTVLVREGKGSKDRTIPIGDRAQLWVQKYLRLSTAYQSRTPDGVRRQASAAC